MKKVGFLFLVITLLLITIKPTNFYAGALEDDSFEKEIELYSETGEIKLYKDIANNDPILSIPNSTIVFLLSIVNEEYSLIKYINPDNKKAVEGYVENIYTNKQKQDNESVEIEEIDENEVLELADTESSMVEKEKVTDEQQEISSQSNQSQAIKEDEKSLEISKKEIKDETSFELKSARNLQTVKSLQGVALKSNTHVYESQSRNAKQLKSYPAGSILKYAQHNATWNIATVFIKGKKFTGYIHKDDVDDLLTSNKSLNGFGLKSPTHVYELTSTNSRKLKSYSIGAKLKYRSFSKNWHVATVYVGGKYRTGYIHKDDVGANVPRLEGYAQLASTGVYESTSKQSKVLKSYKAGHLLKYRPHNSSWYVATVYVGGKYRTGYIHKDDVGASVPHLEGYAQLASTGVYESTFKQSKVLKSYPAGHLLKYRPHNSNWYVATVYVGGKYRTGYIHKDDVGANVPRLEGYAQLASTGVYESTSKQSKVLKSYPAGHLLKYRPHNGNWYNATVYVNGKYQTGYIHKDDVGNSVPSLQGIAMNQPTSVYSATSRNSQVIKNYKSGHLLKYRPYNGSWYEATVFVNGKAQTGYIHHTDVVNPTGKTVMIDAGHGGHDGGASDNGLREKDLTLELALKTQQTLEQSGFNVIMTRTTDAYLSLEERSSLANNLDVDIFVSIHINAGGGTGIESYWYGKHEAEKSKALATAIQEETIRETKSNDRGVKGSINETGYGSGNFHVIRETKMPSTLVEVGFIDNPNDANKLKQESFKNQVVKGIVAGIKKFFQII